MTVKRTFGLVGGWLLMGAALYFSFIVSYLDWNWFDFRVEWSSLTGLVIVGMLGSIVAAWLLARATRDNLSLVVSSLICLALILIGISGLAPEPIPPPGLLARTTPSPAWYRYGRLFISAIPGAVLTFWIWRHRREKAFLR